MTACISCKYHYTTWEGYTRDMCWATGRAEPASGRPIGEGVAVMRSLRGKCGPDARLFVPKPKESFLKRLVRKLKEYV